ncbi:MAG: hypothetical protein KatS3mg131_3105 [Candidatus Tectimicrobiota bacterium]|nr:MAG: hypothetical protein KatS3mg131_3105 [Candidatus Tectomicrobia bacterium]
MRRRAERCCLAVLLSLAVLVAPAGQAQPRRVPVVVQPVVVQPVAAHIEVVGTVEPLRRTTLSSEIAGLALRVPLREGEAVAGDTAVVVQLKATDLELALAEAEAELARAQATAAKLRRGLRPEEIEEKRAEVAERRAWVEKYAKDLERLRALQARQIASTADYELAESTYRAAQAQYERARQALRVAELGTRPEDLAAAEAEVRRLQARVQRLRADVEKTAIRAPFAGFVTRLYTEVGQWVERGGPVAELVDLRRVLVRVPVHEKDVARLRQGDPAEVVLDAFPGQTFRGHVQQIIPQADPASRTFPVKIEVPNTPDAALKAGMSARVRLRLGELRPAVLVPKDAVVRQAGQTVVFVVEAQTARRVPVETGRAVGERVEVLQGALKPGDRVVVTGNETLRDQTPVEVREPAAR